MSLAPRALVLNAPGINCNVETGYAIEQVGGVADQVHISQWRAGHVSLDDYQILALSGGFSHGDDIASGRILGLELRTCFGEELDRFVEAGKAVVGICNGLQVLVESGLLPDGRVLPSSISPATSSVPRIKEISLVNNANNSFEWRWNKLKVEQSKSKFISGDLIGSIVELPSAHQEGRVAARTPLVLDALASSGQVVFSFVDDIGERTEEYPYNPNGSQAGMTGFCDPSGVVLGLMPHPERATEQIRHPNWRRGEGSNPFGAVLFKNIVDYAGEL